MSIHPEIEQLLGKKTEQTPTIIEINDFAEELILEKGKRLESLKREIEPDSPEGIRVPLEDEDKVSLSKIPYAGGTNFQVLAPERRYIWDANNPNDESSQTIILTVGELMHRQGFEAEDLEDIHSLLSSVAGYQGEAI